MCPLTFAGKEYDKQGTGSLDSQAAFLIGFPIGATKSIVGFVDYSGFMTLQEAVKIGKNCIVTLYLADHVLIPAVQPAGMKILYLLLSSSQPRNTHVFTQESLVRIRRCDMPWANTHSGLRLPCRIDAINYGIGICYPIPSLRRLELTMYKTSVSERKSGLCMWLAENGHNGDANSIPQRGIRL